MSSSSLSCSGQNTLLCNFRYIFIEYEKPQDAKDAVKRADMYKLDKSHTLRVNLFSDFEKYVSFVLYICIFTKNIERNTFDIQLNFDFELWLTRLKKLKLL